MATNNYWMKLWFDILRDPKMGMLPDRLWRRVIELFLLAGQEGEDGILPDVSEIAWQLNKSKNTIVADLKSIKKTGIVDQNDDGVWFVTNFKKRNEPINAAKRTKDYRLRGRNENSDDERYESVTKRHSNSYEASQLRNQEEQKNRRTDNLTTTTGSAREEIADVVAAYESEIGVLTWMVRDKLVAALEDYPKDWIIKAFEECASQNNRKWSYAEAILKRWKVDGFQVDTRARKSNNGHKTAKPTSAGLDEILAGAPIFEEDK